MTAVDLPERPAADGPAAVVTGASSGIGLAIIHRLVEGGWRVFASVRREADAARLAETFGPALRPLLFDVRDETAIEAAAEAVRAELGGRPLMGLVNNAGMGNPAPFLHQPLSEIREQIEVNLLGATAVTRTFGPLMTARNGRPGGRILVMSSLGGVTGHPFAAPYCASKHGLEGMAESLRRELSVDGIGVGIVAPGIVATPVWDKVADRDAHRFDATPYGDLFADAMSRIVSEGRRGLSPEAVAETVWQALTEDRPRPRYAPSRRPFLEDRLARIAPRRLVDRLYARRFGLRQGRRGDASR